jgi:Flp pilus assembly protein TadG
MLRSRTLMTALSKARRGGHERGDANVEMIIVFPVFAAMFFAILQGAIWLDAGNIAAAAATTAYNTARTYDGTGSDGTAAGNDFISTKGTNLDGSNVSVNRTATTVTVTVTGRSLTLIPGWFGTEITRTVTGPVERWSN